MELQGALRRQARGRFAPDLERACIERALERFRSFCRFEPETGCVVWTGGKTKGRGHHVDYPSFWYDGERWFGHRWSAKYIHGLDIDGFQVDHCCPHIPKPNTLCVEHVQATTPKENRDLQTIRRRFIHLQVGLVSYRDVYGHDADPLEPNFEVPFFYPPAWLGLSNGVNHEPPF